MEALKPADGSHDERNFVLIAELYQQLKKNYDDRRDYWTMAISITAKWK